MVERLANRTIRPPTPRRTRSLSRPSSSPSPRCGSASARRRAAIEPADFRACPACGGRPRRRRAARGGHGARRVLDCGLCASERGFLRVQCPACEESRFDALPVDTADTTEYVRVDAPDSCRTYIKTVDLTKDGPAVPVVDDLATLPLDLWARDLRNPGPSPDLLRL